MNKGGVTRDHRREHLGVVAVGINFKKVWTLEGGREMEAR